MAPRAAVTKMSRTSRDPHERPRRCIDRYGLCVQDDCTDAMRLRTGGVSFKPSPPQPPPIQANRTTVSPVVEPFNNLIPSRMNTPPSQLPFDAPLKRAPATLEPFLRPVLRGIAIEDISSVASRGPDVGATTLETVENLSPIQNTPENTRENTRATPAGEGEEGASVGHGTVGPARARDAALLLLIIRLRIASIQQLAKAAFPNVSIVVARRRLRALQQGGWLRAWDRPVASGAHRGTFTRQRRRSGGRTRGSSSRHAGRRPRRSCG